MHNHDIASHRPFRFTSRAPSSSFSSSSSSAAAAAQGAFEPDREYDKYKESTDSTESRLDPTRPSHHDEAPSKLKKHKDEPQISIGDV